MSIKQAAEKGGITTASLLAYIKNGYLKTHNIAGYEFVYYRDVLKASWTAKQEQIRAGQTLQTGRKKTK